MKPIIPTQASEAAFNISDYINFDFDFEAPHLAHDTSSYDSAAATSVGMAIENSNLGIPQPADSSSDRIHNLSGHSDTLGSRFGTTQEASEAYDGAGGFHSSRISYPSGSEYTSSNFNVLTTPLHDLDLTDSVQTVSNLDISPNNFPTFEPAALIGGVGGTGLNRWDPSLTQAGTPISSSFPEEQSTPVNLMGGNLPEPSRWVPASTEQQQYLNTFYAPQLSQMVTDPNPSPFLFFPAQEPAAMFTPNHYAQPVHGRAETYADPAAWTPSRNLSLLLQSEAEVFPPQATVSGTDLLIHKDTDADTLSATGSSDKYASDSEGSGYEPVPKRRKIAAAEEPISATAEESSVASKKISEKGSKWRYEMKSEMRARNQRQENWSRRRTHMNSGGGRATNSKMQKMLNEIADTKEFAEAQGYEVEQSGMTRPVRKGAKKSYVGQG